MDREQDMITDLQGNALHGATPEAAQLFDRALESFNIYRGDPAALLTRAVEAAPGFGMAHAFLAWLGLIATEPAAAAAARGSIATLAALPREERGHAHLAALRLLAAGQWSAAARALERYSAAQPRDLLALQIGHLLDFCRADARTLRDRIGRALPQWSADVPAYGILLGMHAFGLEECGEYARAEESGRRAVALQPRDCWAHHAVAHVMEMQGRPEDGLGWMIAREPHWDGDDNFFKVHNWWHRALFHLDLGQMQQVLALYDSRVRQQPSAVAYDLIDASALLWRLDLLGVDVGHRWIEVAQTWDAHADGRTYAFNDWHAVMAWLGAGRHHDVQRMLREWRDVAGDGNENTHWIRHIGLPLIEGFTAFREGDYAMAIERLHATRHFACAFGGSNAQRDVISWTLTEAALRGGQGAFARALVQERLSARPNSALNRGLLARATASPALQRRAA
jgi:tetratricopeptide (TPR) repeat protein